MSKRIFKIIKKTSIKDILKTINQNLKFKTNQNIDSLSSYKCEGKNNLAFSESNKLFKNNLDDIKASCIITSSPFKTKKNIIISSKPRFTFEMICNHFIKNYNFDDLVDGHNLGLKKCGINVKISRFAKIHKNTIFGDNIVVYKNSIIADGAIISSGSVIGNVGVGPYFYKEKLYNCTHLGGVKIDRNTFIGTNSVITRGTLEWTVISKNVAIANLVSIGHNVKINDGCKISSSVSIGGGAKIGKNCEIGLGSTIIPKVQIGSNCKVGANSNVVRNLKKNQSVFGNPAKRIFFINKLF